MNADDVLEIIGMLQTNAIRPWLDGGWGIDALVGKQTRAHSDLDIVVSLDMVDVLQAVLAARGFRVVEDELPTRFVMNDAGGRQIDVHTVTFDAEGGGNQQLQDGRVYRYAPQGFTGVGRLGDVEVRCLSPEIQADCHYGYEPDENDRHDMQLLHDTFNIALKQPYQI